MKLAVSKKQDLTQHIRLIEFVSVDGAALPGYSAGAHIEFDLSGLPDPGGLLNPGGQAKRSYSLIDWALPPPQPTSYTIAVQREEAGDGGSKQMHQLQLLQTISAAAPKNDFELAAGDSPSLLLAGGIGVTPIISMAATLQAQSRSFQLHYCGRSRQVMSFADEMTAAFSDTLTIYRDDETGIDLASLFKNLDPSTQIYLCGPKGLIEAARTAAGNAGFAPELIHIELFSTPATDAADTPFEVELASNGAVYTVPVGKTIIEVLENDGIDLIYDCQRGDCGICQTEVISGTPDHRDVVLSDSERASGKVMQICVSRAKTSRLVLEL